LGKFVPIGKSLDKPQKLKLELDEFGRSFTLGARKTAKAQVWLVKGQGQVYVNGKVFTEIFTQLKDRESILRPFEVTDTLGKYNVWAIANNGGSTGICSLC
jgi:small subunit ribosomal protein S9